MSFSLTTEQYRNRTKDVTRRMRWANMKPGQVFMGVVKGMGLKKGEKVQKIHPARCRSACPVRLDTITEADVVREGFPGKSPAWFVDMFCRHNGCGPETVVNRIEFEHLPDEAAQ